MAEPRYTVEQVGKALRLAKGNMASAARRLGCTRMTVHNYVQRHPTLARIVKDEREAIVDIAEQHLFVKATRGEDWAIKYVLSNLARDRGYGQGQATAEATTEVETPDGSTVRSVTRIVVNLPADALETDDEP